MKTCVAIALLLLQPVLLSAQTITGKIVDQDGIGLSGLRVELFIQAGKYTTTSETDGSFVIMVTAVAGEPLPSGYVVSDNFPNPFNPKTRIAVTMPTSNKVTIDIYNVLGQKVTDAIEQLCNAGETSFDLDLEGLPSGFYVARISIGGKYTVTKKLMLVYGTQHLSSDGTPRHVLQAPAPLPKSIISTLIDSVVVTGPSIARTTFSSWPSFTTPTFDLGNLTVTSPLQTTKTIDQAADSLELLGIKLMFGEGSFLSATSVVVVKDNNVPIDVDSSEGIYDAWNIFKVSALGDTLRKPVRITLSYDSAFLPSGESEADLIVVHFKSTGWEFLQGGVNPQDHTITFDADSFSYFAAGVPTHATEFPTAYSPLDQTITFESQTVPSTQIQSYDYSTEWNAFLRHVKCWWGVVTPPAAIDPSGNYGKVVYAAAFRDNERNPAYSYEEDIQSCLVFKLDLRSVSSAAIEFDYNSRSYPIYDYFVVEITNANLIWPLTNWEASWKNLADEDDLMYFWGNGDWIHERFVFPDYLYNLQGSYVPTCGDPLSDQVFVRIRFKTDTQETTYPEHHAPFLDNVVFRTSAIADPPTVTTSSISSITSTSATGGGNVTSQGSSSVTARGVCWSTSQNPTVSDSKTTNGSGTGSFTSSITGLTPSTTYYVRAYATNSAGTGYGGQVGFTTPSGGGGGNPCPGIPTVSYAGKTYNTVLIGSQCWLKENLDVGTMVLGSVDQTNNDTIQKYCYDNNPDNCATYGGLYQWNEAMQYSTTPGARGICPPGWHVPTLQELETLRSAVSADGNALKAEGQGSGGGAGTNTSGFSALLAGYRDPDGSFYSLSLIAGFWGSWQYDAWGALGLVLSEYDADVSLSVSYVETNGMSVRCLQD